MRISRFCRYVPNKYYTEFLPELQMISAGLAVDFPKNPRHLCHPRTSVIRKRGGPKDPPHRKIYANSTALPVRAHS